MYRYIYIHTVDFPSYKLGSRLIFRREGKWPFDEFHAMLKSLKFHRDFCFVCGDSWQKMFFSLLQNAGKLLCCLPNFGELPQKDLCGQLAQVLTPSPCVDLVFEKGTQGLCVWIFHQLLFGHVLST